MAMHCFRRSSFKCRFGNIIFLVSISSSCRMLGLSGLRSWRPISLHLMLLSSSAVQHAQKTGRLGVSMLLTKKDACHFKVNTDDPLVFGILQQLNESLYVSIFFLKTKWGPKWNCTIWLSLYRTYLKLHFEMLIHSHHSIEL